MILFPFRITKTRDHWANLSIIQNIKGVNNIINLSRLWSIGRINRDFKPMKISIYGKKDAAYVSDNSI